MHVKLNCGGEREAKDPHKAPAAAKSRVSRPKAPSQTERAPQQDKLSETCSRELRGSHCRSVYSRRWTSHGSFRRPWHGVTTTAVGICCVRNVADEPRCGKKRRRLSLIEVFSYECWKATSSRCSCRTAVMSKVNGSRADHAMRRLFDQIRFRAFKLVYDGFFHFHGA